MSVASKNLFAVLDEDNQPATSVIPGTKRTTTSKKSDEPPASKANPARANPNKKSPTGNEAAFRDKNVGKNANRSRATGDDSGRKPPRKTAARPDRKSQTGKSDTDKKVKQGWGDNAKELEEEVAGEAIAKKDEAADAAEEAAAVEEVPEEDNTKTLDQYFAELSTKSLKSDRSVRKPNEGADDASKWQAVEKAEEDDLFVGSEGKKEKVKARKEKATIEPEITFVNPSEQRRTPSNRGPRQQTSRPSGGNRKFNGPRGNAPRGGRQQAGANKHAARRQPSANVDLSSNAEFPTLGA